MTKQDLVKQISEKTGVDRFEVSATIEAAFSLIKLNMSNGENLYVRGFGSFVVRKQAEKKARNISKGTVHMVPARYKPGFKPSPEFVALVRSKLKA